METKMYTREAIEKAKAFLNSENGSSFPNFSSYYSQSTKTGRVESADRTILKFESGNDGSIIISMNGMCENRESILTKAISNESELLSVLGQWKPEIQWWATRITFFSLRTNSEYEVISSFQDYDGRSFSSGTKFIVIDKNYFAKEEGYTINTSVGSLRLQGEANATILENLDLYLEANA